ncbi:MAG: M56 family metallopeptidase [Planctomycetales bacterium]
MSWISDLNAFALNWIALAWPLFWQSSLVIAALFLLLQFTLRQAPRLRHLLWSLVALKLLLLPLWQWTVNLPPTSGGNLLVVKAASQLEKIGSVAADTPAPLTSGQMQEIAARYLAAKRQQKSSLNAASQSSIPKTTTIVPTQPEAPSLSWQGMLFLIWAAGACTLCLNWGRNWWKLRRLLSRAAPAGDELKQTLQPLVRQMRLWRAPRLLLTSENCSPFVCGWWSPTIVLPQSILRTLTPVELQGILLHELAHLRRADLYTRWLPEFATALFWFNPLVRLLRREVQIEAELACDQLVLRQGSVSSRDYAQTIVQVVSRLSQPTWIAETQTAQS